VNQTKNRMQALGLLDRSFKAATDDELATAIEALDDDHREGLESFVEAATPEGVRTAVKAGRINGDMEAIAAIISDLCLADCIKELGDHADNPSTDQLKAVLPGLAERHGVAVTRIVDHAVDVLFAQIQGQPYDRAERLLAGELIVRGTTARAPSTATSTPPGVRTLTLG
jgi:hypothetical protein